MTRSAQFGLLVLAATLWQPLAPARAHSLRCGQDLVPEGSSLPHVLETCGPASHATHRIEHRHWSVVGRDGKATTYSQDVVIDELSYDFGPTEFVYNLRFEDEHMTSMTRGSWGESR